MVGIAWVRLLEWVPYTTPKPHKEKEQRGWQNIGDILRSLLNGGR